LIFGKTACFQFREDLFSVNGYFKAAAVGRNENQFLDFRFEFGDEFFGQTDRFGFVVSNLAVDDFDFHKLSLPT
jgi:hypothetical protein